MNMGNPINFQTVLSNGFFFHIILTLSFLEHPKSATYPALQPYKVNLISFAVTIFQFLEGSESFPLQHLLLGVSMIPHKEQCPVLAAAS